MLQSKIVYAAMRHVSIWINLFVLNLLFVEKLFQEVQELQGPREVCIVSVKRRNLAFDLILCKSVICIDQKLVL
jgi:hypothetical protein